jgi:hypothetical protein
LALVAVKVVVPEEEKGPVATLNMVLGAGVPPVQPPPTVNTPDAVFAVTMPRDAPAVIFVPT